jgi:hypothetical protein
MCASKCLGSNKISFWAYCLLAIVALTLSGAVYRVAASRLKLVSETPIVLPVPLRSFPVELSSWVGKDIPIPDSIQRIIYNDDFLNRLYINESNNQRVNIYIAYSARPRTMLGHRPQVCYVAGGWVHDSTDSSEVISLSGKPIPCLIHRFHKPTPQNDEIVVLNFYIINGELTCNESGFSGVGWRTPNIKGNLARYVAQVQVSSTLENSVRAATKEMTDLILDFFPDPNGEVGIIELPYMIRGIAE